MEHWSLYVLIAALTGVACFVIGWLTGERVRQGKIASAEVFAEKITEDARKEAESIKERASLEAENQWHKAREKFEQDTAERRAELEKLEARLIDWERKLDKKVDILNNKERALKNRERGVGVKERSLQAKDAQLSEMIQEQNERLERMAGMTSEEAKALLMANLEQRAKQEAAQRAKEIKDRAVVEAEREAKQIIGMAIQRCAADHTVESTVSVVALPSDEMKGRIIGREGRNIRAFENATGVDVIVDDTPEAVILSGFNSIRREVAKIALERLISDGRIHPGRIEEVVEKAQKDMEGMIQEAGEQAAFDVGVHGVDPKLLNYLGRLQYRTSYGQNVLQHSKEVSILAGLMASELELDEMMARRAGLLHDIGKSVDQDLEGTHTQIGVELARRYDEGPEVQNAIAGHHEDVPATSLTTVLVEAADAISGGRPGARRETLEGYVKRLERLEELADSFSGVDKAYAIQAGREIRVMVDYEEVDDAYAEQLSSDIADRIEEEMEYPGQIKVTVIREVRAVDYAR